MSEIIDAPDARRLGHGRGAFGTVVFASAVAFFYMSTKGTWNPDYERPELGFASRFFFAQAQSIVHGHLYVDPTQLPDECFIHAGRCYGYFGLSPSLIRIPFLPILDATNHSLTPIFLTLALTTAVAFAVAIFRLLIAGRVAHLGTATVFAGVLLGPGSVLVQIARPAVYEEAIAWAVASSCVATYALLRWWRSLARSWAIVIVVALAFGANSRPTVLFGACFIGLAMLVRLARDRAPRWRLSGGYLFAVAAVATPFVTALGVYWLKLGHFIPSLLGSEQIAGPTAQPWWVAIRKVDHNQLESPRFIPTALLAYVRTNSIFYQHGFPWVSFSNTIAPMTYIGVPPQGMFIGPIASITDDMPIGFIATGCALGIGAVRSLAGRARFASWRDHALPLAIALCGALASLYPTLSTAALAGRYVGDFYPAAALIIVIGLAVVVPYIDARARFVRIGIWTVLAAALVVEIWINYSLAHVAWWT